MDYELCTFHHELERVHLRGQIDLKHKYVALKGDTSISKEITTKRKVLVRDHTKETKKKKKKITRRLYKFYNQKKPTQIHYF